ncbi:uncharacterized protein LOC117340604 [Pecten maximus]|uniref:uncharacterized protein LOC117340604 n=1 Tax=Pecten maximus TaxID=6579 RepID=UPI001458A792|nr:uncharacterized protein LOC117340604 [Pecten maximus]
MQEKMPAEVIFCLKFLKIDFLNLFIKLRIATQVPIPLNLNDAVTLTGSSEYAVPGTEFTLTCDVPEEATLVQFYRRPDLTTPVGVIQVGGGQCYNVIVNPAVPCTSDVCSCATPGGLGTVFRWIIQPQTGDHGSVWFCRRNNYNLPEQQLDSDNYTLSVADGLGSSIGVSPPDTIYTRTEGDTLPDITCTADCRPGCTFVWTRPDNTNFTVSPVLSLGQLDRSEHGTYRCTARNVVGESTITISITVQYGPGSSLVLSPMETKYTGVEGDTLPDITCTADCRPDCTLVWTRPDNTNSTVSPVLSLGRLDRSEHGTYRCTAWNVVGESTKVINVTVKYEPQSYQMLNQNLTLYLSKSETIILSSAFISNPVPSFMWFCDGSCKWNRWRYYTKYV